MDKMIFNLTAESVCNLIFKQRPTYYVEIGKKTLNQIRQMKDDQNNFFWQPCGDSGTFLGYPIKIVEGEEFKLVTVIHKYCNVVSNGDDL